MLGNLPFPILRDAIVSHPTTSEAEGLVALLTNGMSNAVLSQ
jgi:hypothetical protein